MTAPQMDRFARGQFNVAFEQRIDHAALRGARVERALAQIERDGLDALLLWKEENVRYLTDLRPQIINNKATVLNGALLVPGFGPILLCSGGEADRIATTMPWIREFHIIPILEQKAFIDAFVRESLAGVLAEHGLSRCRLGVDETSTVLHLALQRELPGVEVLDGDTPMQLARRIKLPDEITIIEEATAIADAVCASATAAVAEGRREWDVVADAIHTLFTLGAEYPHLTTPFVASGEHMAPPHRFSTEKIIRHGDIVFIDIGAGWNGYYGDMARTVICGKPVQRQREIYTAAYESLQAGIAEMRPGNTERQAAEAFRRGAARLGLQDRFFSLFIGHGIGMGSNEPPYIGETNPGSTTFTFEAGMVFAVEPLIWEPGVRGGGGARLEEMVLITDGEPHVISRAPFDDRLLLPA